MEVVADVVDCSVHEDVADVFVHWRSVFVVELVDVGEVGEGTVVKPLEVGTVQVSITEKQGYLRQSFEALK